MNLGEQVHLKHCIGNFGKEIIISLIFCKLPTKNIVGFWGSATALCVTFPTLPLYPLMDNHPECERLGIEESKHFHPVDNRTPSSV